MDKGNGFINRRNLLKLAGIGGACLMATTQTSWNSQVAKADEPKPTNSSSMESSTALQRLMDGNQRFLKQIRTYPDQSLKRLQEVSQAQHPFAVLVSCADSRVPPEVLFDQGIGDIFDIRIAGNIITPEVLGSIEYATKALGTQLVMVLGHERCGAVTAAVKGEVLPGSISTFVKAILPVVEKVKVQPGDPVDNAVNANVNYQIERMKQGSALIAQQVSAGTLKIVGGRYDLDTGKVTLL